MLKNPIGLKKAGYATNPRYPEILIRFIEENNLQQYDSETIFVASNTDKEPKYEIFNEPVQKNNATIILKTPEFIKFSIYVINGSKAIYAPEGTSLLAIASKHKIHLSKLLEMNDLKKDGLLKRDQFVFLERKSSQGENEIYTVEEGETIYDIAQKNGILLQSILIYNKLEEDDQLFPGKKLYLKKPTIAIGKFISHDLKNNI